MKKWLLLLFITGMIQRTAAQEIPSNNEQQLENLAGDEEAVSSEDDSWLQELEQFKKHPVNINTADGEEFKQLRILTELQIFTLLHYRKLLGPFVSLYELQAVPAWDIATIKKILPFIAIRSAINSGGALKQRFKAGEHSFLLRVSRVLQWSKGFKEFSNGNGYPGSPQRIFIRYKYVYRNLLHYGIIGEKDPGEQFMKNAQARGFDFYSVHLFLRNTGSIESLALGDFTVNMGQGLIQWQGMAFKKSAEVMGIKRQSAVLRPYSSAGEFNFFRGAGITVRKNKLASTVFVSMRKLSANLVTDTLTNKRIISSFLSSGYHRTAGEAADRNSVTQITAGGNLLYNTGRWQAGINGVYHQFSVPVQKRNEPYNRYAISGTNWYNCSLDYSYTYKNLHFFGELATDKYLNPALLNGLLLSVDPRVDLSLLHRHLSPAYQSLYGNAFTENTYPTNESGCYAGVSVRPATAWRIEAYADIFRFPWLKYRTDASSYGTDLLAQLTYAPGRQFECYTRYRNESKQANRPGNDAATRELVFLPRQSWRTQLNYKLNTTITIRMRSEILWYDKRGSDQESGFLLLADLLYKPLLKPWSGNMRVQYFETDGYNSRVYAYENDVLYSYAVPALFEKGYRYYFNLAYDLGKKYSVWVRWGGTIYPGKTSIGSDLDEIAGHLKTELKLQFRLIF